jgi:ATP-dependent DNA ligase
MREWKFQSSSSPKVYTTQINPATNLLSCDCPGWTVKKLGKTRECKHTKKVIADEGLVVDVRDDQQFVSTLGGTSPEELKAFKQVYDNAPTVQEILGEPPHAPSPPAPESPKSPGKFTMPIPTNDVPHGFISPMLASKMPEGNDADSYNTPDYIMEEKFDGHRIVVRIAGPNLAIVRKVAAWSRLGNPRTLPDHLINLLRDMPDGVYDGELIVPGQHSYDVTEGQNSGTEKLVLFDCMEVLGHSVMSEPWRARRAYLEEAIKALDNQNIISVAAIFIPDTQIVKMIWARGGEGTIIKNLNSKYQPGWRTPDWVKVKAVLAATLEVIGFEAGKNGPYSVVRLRDDAGIETTVKTLDNKTMRQIALNPDGFIGKRLVISYQEKMPSGKYRHPMWDHEAGIGE